MNDLKTKIAKLQLLQAARLFSLTDNSSTFQLSRTFSIVSLAAILIAALILSWMYSVLALDDIKQQGENNNIVLTQTFANAIWPQVKFIVEASNQASSGPDLQKNQLQFNILHDSILKLITDTPVLKIKIFNLNNMTIYSTEEDQVGSMMAADYPGNLSLQTGKAITELEFRALFKSIIGTLSNRYILSTYLPIQNPATRSTLAVFQVYTDVTSLHSKITESRNNFAIAVIIILGLVYTVLFLLVRHADHVIRKQANEREQYLREIESINRDLDKNARELALAHDKAVEASTSKSQFLANMSHELRTPLNAIIGYSEMLTEDLDESQHPQEVDDLKRIQGAGKHLLSVINEILDISKIEAGSITLHIEEFDVRNEVESIVATVQPLAKQGNNQFNVHYDNRLGTINTDITRFRQILLNLLSNACKFSNNGHINLTVTREGHDDVEHIVCVISDTGIGIPEDKLEKIFEPFQQADSSTTREHGGTGLGLTISKRFCEMMGGSIRVESTLNVGTSFYVKLPTQTAAQPDLDRPRPRLPDSTNHLHNSTAGTERRRKTSQILVIDDDSSARDLIKRYLEKQGFSILLAENASQGLALAQQTQPDLITLDVMLPGMNGWTVLQKLKRNTATQEIPVIVISIVKEEKMGYSLGAVDYLTKPIEWPQLGESIRKWLRTT